MTIDLNESEFEILSGMILQKIGDLNALANAAENRGEASRAEGFRSRAETWGEIRDKFHPPEPAGAAAPPIRVKRRHAR